MEEKVVTREDLLKYAIDALDNVNVPGKYLLQIGRPIANALDALGVIAQIFEAENKEREKAGAEANPDEAPQLTLVKEEPDHDGQETVSEAGE